MYKIIVAHPGKQLSLKLAESLYSKGYLFTYFTTIYYKQNSLIFNLLSLFLSKDNKYRLKNRRSQILPDEKIITYFSFFGLISLFLLRIDHNRIITNKWMNLVSDLFSIKVAKFAIKNKVDAVIMYDTNSKKAFNYLKQKAPFIKRIIDNSHPARNYLYEVYNKLNDTSGHFIKTLKAESDGFLFNKEKANNYKEEILSADINIVASTFSKESILYCGFPENKIIVAPYGIDNHKKNISKDFSKINVLFVGQVNQRKGIKQILDAAKDLHGLINCSFSIVGSGMELFPELYKPYFKYINFYGRVSKQKLDELYQSSNLFLFPTLGEGFGMVILEALSFGLPVICSKNCASYDLISDKYNGYVIDAGDKNAIVQHILFLNKNKSIMAEMSQNAYLTSLNFTWDKYNHIVTQELGNFLFNK
jgi:glycosyltransferase involved in cell wall biosynthesis